MRPALLAAALCIVAAPAAAEAIYVNHRFGYSICHPPQLRPQGESDNGDGQTFQSQGGARLIVYGAHNVFDETLPQRRAETVERLGPASYVAGKADWFVVSGRSGDTIYYAKTALRRGVFVSMELTYPTGLARDYDVVAARLSSCFRTR